MTHDDLSDVIGADLCIGCGVCVHADPSVELVLDPEAQIWRPSHASNQRAASVCPAVAVDYEGLQARRFPGSEPDEYGVVRSVMLAQSTNEDRNRRASSGGLIKELLIDLLEQGDATAAIALGEVGGLDYEPRLITSADEVDRLPGSIYHNLPKHRVLDLLRETEGPVVLVGIPCEFEGLFQYIYAYEPELETRIGLTIGLLCGWQYSFHSLRAITEYKGLDFDRIERVSYRGGGPVGKLRIEAGDREVAVSRRVDFGYQVAFDRTFNTPRCHVCINHGNFLADVVVGDAWLPSTVGTTTGISLIVNRTDAADALMRRLDDKGRILVSDVTTEEIKESQKPRIAFGDFAYAYADYRRELGLPTPDLEGPNRSAATPSPRSEVAFFHRELTTKLALQRQRRYRRLYWRKATKELPRFIGRYWEWFAVRILRVKSLRGERQELSRSQVSIFR